MRTKEELALSKEYIKLIIADHLCLPIAEVTDEKVLMPKTECHGVFCLILSEIADDLGAEFDIDIEPGVYENWVTVGDVEGYIKNTVEEM